MLKLSHRFRDALPALRGREFRRYFAAQSLSLVGVWMQMVALSWLVYELTGSPARLGIFGALGTLPLLLLGPFSGGFADRHSRRNVLMATQGGMAILAAILATLHAMDRLSYPWILVIAVCQGIVFSFDMPARQSLVVELVGTRHVGNAVALNSSLFNGARLVGPAVAGLILARFGPMACFLVNAVSYLPVIVVLGTIRPRISATHGSRPPGLREGLSYVAGHRLLRSLLAVVGVVSVFGFSVGTLLPVFAGDVFGRGADGYGLLVASMGLGAFSGALAMVFWGSRRPARPSLALGLVCMSGGIILTGLVRSFLAAQALAVAVGFGLVLFHAAALSLIQLTVPDRLRGRITGLWGLAFLGLSPVGQLQIGFAAERIGPRPTVVLAGSICLVGALLFLRHVREPSGSGIREVEPVLASCTDES